MGRPGGAHRTPTLAAVQNEAAALPPGTSMQAGRSPGAQRAAASVDGGRHEVATHQHDLTEAAEHFAPRGSDASSRRGAPRRGDRRQVRVGTRGRLTRQRFRSQFQGDRGPAALIGPPRLRPCKMRPLRCPRGRPCERGEAKARRARPRAWMAADTKSRRTATAAMRPRSNSRRGAVTRAAGEGPRNAGIDGKCESAHEADSRCNESVYRSKEAEARRRSWSWQWSVLHPGIKEIRYRG